MKPEIQHQQAGEKLIVVLAFTLVLSSMSATLFNIVLPEMSQEFALGFSQVSWIASSYMLIYAIGAVIYGKLADTYPLKHLLTFGLSVFFIGSIFGLLSQAYWMVLLARILQAAGASVIPAAGMMIPIRYFPPERRGRALGVTATGLALGTAIGPILSSLVVTLLHWRWLFCIPLLILFTLPFYRKYLNEEQGKGGNIDWIGGSLLAVTVALLLMAVTQGQSLYAAGSLIFFILFILRIRTAAEPFVKAALFRNKDYTIGLLIAAFISGIGYSITFLTPKLLSDVHQLASGWIGFVMVPAAITSAILGRKAGKLADQKGNTFLFCFAALLLLSCLALISTFSGWHPLWIMGFLIFGNVGQMFMQIALTGAISRTLPQGQTGVGMGLLSLFGFLTMAMSSGIYSAAAELDITVRLNPLQSGPVVYSNIYAMLALIIIAVLIVFLTVFRSSVSPALANEKTIPSE